MERCVGYCTHLTQVGKFSLLGQTGRLETIQGNLALANSFLLATEIRTPHEATVAGRCCLLGDLLLAILFVQSVQPILPTQVEKFLDLTADLTWSAGSLATFAGQISTVNGVGLTYALLETSLHWVPVPYQLRMVVGVGAGVVQIIQLWQDSPRDGL